MPFRNTIDEIRRRAGLPPVEHKKEKVTEAASSDEAIIYLADDEDMMQEQQPTEVRLIVSYDVEPTEYDGPHVFYQGGVDVNGAKIYQTFQFMGKQYPHSQSFPEELLRYVVHPSGETIHRHGQDPWNSFMDHLGEQLSGNVQVPSHRYPDSRGQ